MSMFSGPGGSIGGVGTGQQLVQVLGGIDSSAFQGAPPPSEAFVTWLHGQSSTTKPEDIHHALGFGEFNAAVGNHRHNGKDSLKIIPDNEFALPVDLTAGASTTDIVNSINQLNKLCRTYLGSN